jgi:hypothetical protein
MNDPVQYTVQMQGVLNAYKSLTAKSFNVDHNNAIDMLTQLKELCEMAIKQHQYKK